MKTPVSFRSVPALFFVCFAALATIPQNLPAANVYVPATQPTIQAGIDSASNGDTVYVADGIWKGSGNINLNFNGKAITVRSENGPYNSLSIANRTAGASRSKTVRERPRL